MAGWLRLTRSWQTASMQSRFRGTGRILAVSCLVPARVQRSQQSLNRRTIIPHVIQVRYNYGATCIADFKKATTPL